MFPSAEGSGVSGKDYPEVTGIIPHGEGDTSPSGGRCGIRVTTSCAVNDKTGIEMEALTAASVTCLTIYDMCKAVDRGMEIGPIRLLRKEGGKHAQILRPGHA